MSVAVEINQAIQETGTTPPQNGNKRIPTVNRTVPKKTLESKLWDLLQPIARLWGLITAIVMSGAGAQLTVLDYEIAPGLIVGAVLIFLLETMWVVALFVDLLCRRGEYSMKLRCWDFMRWSCGRARAPFYACVATAILFANLTILATVSGNVLWLCLLPVLYWFSVTLLSGRTKHSGSS
ncbi:jg13654 [Pararge aegeria aegeria]|uniref:Jg13654 protein n=1 Tax=Pararge aegeria aegeria TaxID=348720 RepID=A0A8S4SHQ8_9NEOP|nr:jg13654 [Pararge aegeria aegeria]